jgi:hypothetical protein
LLADLNELQVVARLSWVRIPHRYYRDPTDIMKCVPSLRLVRIAVVALSGFLAVGVTASEARAECGDYVIVGRPLLNSSNHSAELRLEVAMQSAYSHDEPADHRRSTPCHGPSCSRRDPVPVPSAPTGVVPTTATDWAFLVTGIFASEFEPERFFSHPNLQLPECLPTPIEHPPRAV